VCKGKKSVVSAPRDPHLIGQSSNDIRNQLCSSQITTAGRGIALLEENASLTEHFNKSLQCRTSHCNSSKSAVAKQ
jgi:hypothetical protein